MRLHRAAVGGKEEEEEEEEEERGCESESEKAHCAFGLSTTSENREKICRLELLRGTENSR